MPVGLAVSGGPDSVALMLLASAVLPGRFAVATVDHGLRAESAGEAGMVARLCRERGVAHRTITLALPGGAGVQARARTARYAALGDWLRAEGLGALVTAHHADDQAETFFMRLNRGAGVRGLAGMRARAAVPGHPDVPLLRPLLGWRRAELATLVAAAGITPADDPSNRDPRFERVRVRAALASGGGLDVDGLIDSMAHLADADAAIEWMAERAFATARRDADGLVWTMAVPRAVALRVLERIVAELGAGQPRGPELARWHDALEAGGIATLAGVRGEGRGAEWRFTRAAPHRGGDK
jgi:tRNA(Ile)-lysidine synthase